MCFSIDMHCDTMVRGFNKPLRNSDLCVTAEKMKKGKAMAQFFALYIPKDIGSRESVNGTPFLDRYNDLIEKFRHEIAQNSDLIAQARTADEILANHSKGLMSAVITLEDGFVITDLDRLERFYADGVRVIGIIWNHENQLGYPNSADPDIMSAGLKPFGFQVVERCNQLGIGIDVSHLSDGGFFDVAAHSKKPFFATHSNARALCNHPRNLTDEQLRLLAEKGGVVGLNYYDAFLRLKDTNVEPRLALTEDIVRHAVYIANVAGVESVGFGSDFDGIDNEVEFKDWAGHPTLTDALSRHFTPSQMEKICRGNVLRVLRDIQTV